MNIPSEPIGLHHVALNVAKFDETLEFYTDVLGMKIEWQPDSSNVFLTNGTDNLALRRIEVGNEQIATQPRLDHLGFIIPNAHGVDQWHDFMTENGIPIIKGLKNHRDGSRSFFVRDPDGTLIQMIYHPPLANSGGNQFVS